MVSDCTNRRWPPAFAGVRTIMAEEIDLEPGADLDRAERARKLFSGPIAFLKSAPALEHLPTPGVSEIAFAGRSNVGKSSLLNALTNRNGLARTSVTPGRTQELNYFDVGEPLIFRLVDMPGYGFAKAPVAVVAKWQTLLKNYLSGRPTLRRAFALIDSRHGVKDVDHEIMRLLDRSAVPFQVVLTKADKIGTQAMAATVAQVQEALQKHPAAYPELVLTSSEKGQGIATLRAIIAGLD